MGKRLIIVATCLALLMATGSCWAGSSQQQDSKWWSKIAHEENSVVASVVYIPYVVLTIPVRLIDGIINPVPTSRSTTPPAAHRASH